MKNGKKYQKKLYLFEKEPRQQFCLPNLQIARKADHI
jgi:hypothetical protein